MVRAMTKKHKLPILRSKPKPRQCGTCVECCVVPEAPYLDKARLERCSKLGETKGCSDYENRPEECKGFHCMWLLDGLDKELRPDRCGLIVATNLEAFRKVGIPHTVVVWETWRTAATYGAGGRLVDFIARTHAVVVNTYEGQMQVVGSPDKAGPVMAALQKMRG